MNRNLCREPRPEGPGELGGAPVGSHATPTTGVTVHLARTLTTPWAPRVTAARAMVHAMGRTRNARLAATSRRAAELAVLAVALGGTLAACGPAAHLPGAAGLAAAARGGWPAITVLHVRAGQAPTDPSAEGAVPAASMAGASMAVAGSAPAAPTGADSVALARAGALAPTLLTHASEPFGLARTVAVVHPTRPVVAYHLLWDDDAHGAWLPGTVATDQEVVWVAYDPSGAPTDLWTYWHGNIVHTPWPGRQVVVTVQWGKHGSLPLGTRSGGLPRAQRPGAFWAYTWLGLPDFFLGNISRPGPFGFFRSKRSYAQLDRPVRVADRLDLVVRAERPEAALAAVFGDRWSRKPAWPWERHG